MPRMLQISADSALYTFQNTLPLLLPLPESSASMKTFCVLVDQLYTVSLSLQSYPGSLCYLRLLPANRHCEDQMPLTDLTLLLALEAARQGQ